MPRALLALLLAALAVPAAVRADSACLSDAQRYCAQIPIGEGRVLTCLQARWKDLSSACQQEIQRIQNRSREVDQACSNDVWSFCQGVVPGADRIRVCLVTRWDDLSSTCRDKVAEISEKAEKLRQDCAADVERLCPGLKPGGGQLWLCLKAQESKTSGACQAALR
ncbi:MAG TPA: cysteine rich repeat-containing protein [Myxococcales bacterium]|nr:cysteine rich repeat-containing protein [Myxococcales bacterium]